MGNILKRHGLLPAPERKTTTTWKGFIRTHMNMLVATDFFTAEVWTLGGLVTYYVLFFIHLGSRQVHVAGMTPHPDQIWMMQIACNVTMEEWGFLSRGQYLNAPPDTAQVIVLPPLVYSAAFVVGLLLHLAFPFHILPTTLARGIGAVCVLVSLLLALTTFRVLSRAHTPVDPMKPTTALVTEGPFRYSRNLIYFALTLLYPGSGVALQCAVDIAPGGASIGGDSLWGHRRFSRREISSQFHPCLAAFLKEYGGGAFRFVRAFPSPEFGTRQAYCG